MKKLAEKEYWDSVYKEIKSDGVGNGESFLKNWLKNITRDYSNYLMWENILPKYLPNGEKFKVIEIGCAPGKYLIKFKKQFGFEPFGVEYSKDGVKIARENFLKNNIDPQNIIEADFFDKGFQEKYKEKFDLVVSRGFIEHFENVTDVVEKHFNLIKSGGYVIISIPNVSGVNKILGKFLNYESYLIHNTFLMNKEIFLSFFPNNVSQKLYGDYLGFFSFGIFNTNKKWKYYLHHILLLIQRPFDFILRNLFKNGNLRSSYFSPYLLFIGKKK